MTATITFRMPQGWPAYLDELAHTHHFSSRSEMLSLVLTECAYNALTGIKIKGGRIEPPTLVVGCRLPESTCRAIREYCCKQIEDTTSVWATLVVARWAEDLKKQDDRAQKRGMYWLYLRDFAEHYRAKVAGLQLQVDKIMRENRSGTRLSAGG